MPDRVKLCRYCGGGDFARGGGRPAGGVESFPTCRACALINLHVRTIRYNRLRSLRPDDPIRDDAEIYCGWGGMQGSLHPSRFESNWGGPLGLLRDSRLRAWVDW